ncbi:SRPBCC domain-containing protein [Nocardia jiangsuensis]|uniref:SRPBCC domain-containing protein n=1 Tax=Nocardia jiangsuensis TaxID=1691563 RepID=A0ABV8DS96_9NOCA
MTAPEEDARVLPLTRPPIRRSVLVRAGRARTWAVFVGRMAEWWPLDPFSAGKARVRDVTVQARVGGTVAEVWDDGTVIPWGEVLTCAEPEHFAMTWNITGTPTEVALRFRAVAPALTKVDLEHTGWDRLDTDELRRDCALPGGYEGGAVATGWDHILAALQRAAAQEDE